MELLAYIFGLILFFIFLNWLSNKQYELALRTFAYRDPDKTEAKLRGLASWAALGLIVGGLGIAQVIVRVVLFFNGVA